VPDFDSRFERDRSHWTQQHNALWNYGNVITLVVGSRCWFSQ